MLISKKDPFSRSHTAGRPTVYTPRGLHFVLILGLISFAFLSDWGSYNGGDRGDASIGLMMSEQGEEISTPFAPRKLYSVFSTDLQDMKYASLAPLSAYVWKHHLGVTLIHQFPFFTTFSCRPAPSGRH